MPDLFDKLRGRYERSPAEGEMLFFSTNPTVAGYAADDGKVVLNPSKRISDDEKRAVFMNELVRIKIRKKRIPEPDFDLSDEQSSTLNGLPFYSDASEGDRRATIAGRLFSGDPSGGKASPQQKKYIKLVEKYFEDDAKWNPR